MNNLFFNYRIVLMLLLLLVLVLDSPDSSTCTAYG